MAPMVFRTPLWASAVVLGVAALLFSLALPPAKPVGLGQDTPNALAWAEDGPWLLPGREVHGHLQGGFRAYKVFLQAGRTGEFEVGQKGIDVIAALWSPQRKLLLVSESPFGDKGPERLFIVARSTGLYHLIVQAQSAGESGSYTARLLPFRSASPQDRLRALAASQFSQGEWWLQQIPRYRSALCSFERALLVWQQLGDGDAIVETRHRIAATHAEINTPEDRDRATLIWEREVLPAWKGTFREPLVLNQIGEVSSPASAGALFRTAFDLADKRNDHAQMMRALNNLISIYLSQGQFQSALETLQSALALVGPSAGERSRIYVTAAELYRGAGSYETSIYFSRQALALLDDTEGQALRIDALNNLGLSLYPLGKYDDALGVLSQGKELAERSQSPEALANIFLSLGTVFFDRFEKAYGNSRTPHDLTEADQFLQQALEQARLAGDEYFEANALSYLGRTRDLQGKGSESVELCEAARNKYQDLGYSFGIAGTNFCLARALHTVGRPDDALAAMNTAVELLEGLRKDPLSSRFRIAFMGARRRFYQFQIELLMELAVKGMRSEASVLEKSEAFRARAFLEELSARASASSPPDPVFARQREKLEKVLRESAPELQLLSPEIAPDRAATLQSKVRNLVVRLELLRSSARARDPRKVQPPRLLTLDEIQNEVLGDGTLLLEYMLGEERSFLWLVGKDLVRVYPLPRESEIRDLAQRYAELVADRDPDMQEAAEAVGKELGRVLLGDVAEKLGDHRLLISPDGALFRIPFEALPSPRTCPAAAEWHGNGPPPLILCNEVVYSPSASVLAEVRTEAARRPRPPKALAALGDPVFGRDDPRLPASRARGIDRIGQGAVQRSLRSLGMGGLERLKESGIEVRKITSGLGKEETLVVTGFGATRELATSRELAQYRIIHFATHSLLLSDFPELTGLVFSQLDERGKWQDGFLPLYEIYDLHLPVDLIVLSACRTARGQEVRGEGVVGLARAFQSAGASRVIVSLWDVDDKATSVLMRAFYRNVFNGRLNYAAALRQARIAMLSDPGHPEWATPYYWAPFIIQGEWR